MVNEVCFTKGFCINTYVLIAIIVGLLIFLWRVNSEINGSLLRELQKQDGKIQQLSQMNGQMTNMLGAVKSRKDTYMSRIFDVLQGPEVSYVPSTKPMSRQSNTPEYQQMGYVVREETDENYNPDGNNRMKMFGRPEKYGSNKYEYYVMDGTTKVPLDNNKEIDDGDNVNVDGLSGDFKTKIYDTEDNFPYNPFSY